MGGVNNAIRDSVLFTTADSVINWSRRSALWPETFGIACCAIEMISAGCARCTRSRAPSTSGALVRPLDSRIARLRWMRVPIAAYLLITRVLPMANGV